MTGVQSGMDSSVPAENTSTIRQFFAHLSSGDLDVAETLVDPAGSIWALGTRQERQLGDWIKRFGALLETTKDGLTFTLGPITAQDNRVAVVAESYAEFGDGLVYNNLYHFLIELSGGKIVKIWEYYDTAYASKTKPHDN